MKKYTIEYESEKLMSPELREMIDIAQERIIRDHGETDKLICHISRLRTDIINWLDDYRK